MSGDHDFTQKERTHLERLEHPLVLLIVLDLVTFGLYSACRSYFIHNGLSRKMKRRIFSLAYLHILVLLNVAHWVLRFSRDSQPLDASMIMVRLGSGLLFISLLLIFRRILQEEFHLRLRPWPLAIFGFWYLQYRINRAQRHPNPLWRREAGMIPALAAVVYVGLSLAPLTVKHYRVSHVSMEPTLVVGDYVLVDRLTYALAAQPEPGDLLVFQASPAQPGVTVKRVLGLPGDRISFHPEQILVNGQPLPCTPAVLVQPPDDAFDKSPKRATRCQLADRSFDLHRYQKGALTAVHGEFEVPPDHYFVVGDNLDNSSDSRTMGAISADKVLGLARMTSISYRLTESIPWHRWFQILE